VYKKFLVRKGKRYGPYLYENKRVGQKVVTNYVGKAGETKKDFSDNSKRPKKFIIGLYALAIIAVLLLILDILIQISPTGWFALDLHPKYIDGEPVSGFVSLNFNGGELIPKNSQLYAELGGQKKVFSLYDLVETKVLSGDFYAKNTFISGSGEGYGIEGEKTSYPAIEFDFKVITNEEIEETQEEISGGTGETGEAGVEEIISEAPPAPEQEAQEQTTDQSVEQQTTETSEVSSSESSAGSSQESSGASSDMGAGESGTGESSAGAGESSGITGSAIIENVIHASVSKDSPFHYNLRKGETAELVSGSVSYNNEQLSDNVVDFSYENNILKVNTDYSILESGFGKDFLTDETSSVKINLGSMNLSAENGTLGIKLVYDDNLIGSVNKEILTIPSEENETETAESAIIANITQNISIKLLKNIETIRIKSGASASINLDEYFENAVSYGFNVDNISAVFSGENKNFLVLTPDNGFSGARRAKILAYREQLF
jgi:hypothetical protein